MAQIEFPVLPVDLADPWLTDLPPACAISTPVLPLNSCARKMRLKSFSFFPCDRTLMYFGGAGY